jgi:hypothetical protein
MTVTAVGGYGRGTLAPGSDIDLLFVLPYKNTPWTEQVVEWILYILWDMGLKVGHATRNVDECIRLSRSDMTIRTAILEARFLCGERALFDDLGGRFESEVVDGTGPEFIAAKLAERDERHRKAGETRYLVEPNIKDGKGGLRDLQTLFWIAKYFYRIADRSDLVRKGVLSRAEYNTFVKCEDFLHEALLPCRQGCRRPHAYPVREAGREPGQIDTDPRPHARAAAAPDGEETAGQCRLCDRHLAHQCGPRDGVRGGPGQSAAVFPACRHLWTCPAPGRDTPCHAVAEAGDAGYAQ